MFRDLMTELTDRLSGAKRGHIFVVGRSRLCLTLRCNAKILDIAKADIAFLQGDSTRFSGHAFDWRKLIDRLLGSFWRHIGGSIRPSFSLLLCCYAVIFDISRPYL